MNVVQLTPATFGTEWKRLIRECRSFVICFRMTPCPPCEKLKPFYNQLADFHHQKQSRITFYWLDITQFSESVEFNYLFVNNKIGLPNEKRYNNQVPFVFCSFYDANTKSWHHGTSSTTNLQPLHDAIERFCAPTVLLSSALTSSSSTRKK